MKAPSLKPDSEVKPDEAKIVPDQAKPDEAKPDEAKPDQAKPDQAKIDTVSDEVKPDEVKPDEVKSDVPCLKTIGKAIDRLDGNLTADQVSSQIALSHSLVGDNPDTPLEPAERNPSNWNILAGPLGISARNSTTGRVYNGPTSGFNKLLRGA